MDTLTTDFIDTCKILIASAKTDEALKTLLNSFAQSQHEILLLSSKWADLKKQKISGVISEKDFQQERMTINKHILTILDDIENDSNISLLKNKLEEKKEVRTFGAQKNNWTKNNWIAFFLVLFIFIIGVLGFQKGFIFTHSSVKNNSLLETKNFDMGEEKYRSKNYLMAAEYYHDFLEQFKSLSKSEKQKDPNFREAYVGRINSLFFEFNKTKKNRKEVLEECNNFREVFDKKGFPLNIMAKVHFKLGHIEVADSLSKEYQKFKNK
ncbi:MAG TPA: hypothetical protein ENJ95_15290 [Bacteroidetes bacterium]|nr:hypothetical protein [Bacteroidota bacterium]